jgi:peptidoglycan/LPS O-acetylase OafA/YrhL
VSTASPEITIVGPIAAQAATRREARTQPRARTGEAFYIPSLDGIRAAAVMLVFVAHAGLNDRVPGSFGVTAFFFLSGYLITTLLRMEFDRTGAISLRAFYLRRSLRIFPPMYLVLLGATALTLSGLMDGAIQPGAFAAQAFYLSNYYIVQHGWWDGRAPGTWIYWSLAVEEHFYFIFPLLYIGLRRWLPSRMRQTVVLFGLCAAVLAWRLVLVYALGAGHDRTYVASDTRVDSILFGCVLAVWANPVLDLDKSRISDRWWKWALFPLGVGGLLISYLIPGEAFGETFRYTLQGLSLLPLFAIAVRYPDWGIFSLLNHPWVRYVGVVSYSIYLMHPTVLYMVHEWTPWNGVVQGALSLALTLALSTAMYRLVEQPCARLRKRLSRIILPTTN